MTIKLKFLPRIPANLVAGDGIIITEAGNNFTIAIDATAGVFQLADTDLQALADNSTNGFWARTASGTGAARTLTGTANEITVTNGDGSGVPTFSLPTSLTFTGKTVTGGTFSSPTITAADARGTWTAGATWTLPALVLGGAVTASGSRTYGMDLSGGTYSDATILMPNNAALAQKESGGTVRSVIGISSANALVIGNTSMNTFFDAGSGSVVPASDNSAHLGGPSNRWADVTTVLVKLAGSSSGTITMQGQAAAGTFNWNLPTTAGSSGDLLKSGGGGSTAMSWLTPGTGVATALAVNVGTDGAFVVKGGALGSPSSVGTMPAFTLGGTISGGGNSINNVAIGSSSPGTGAFTNLTGDNFGITGTGGNGYLILGTQASDPSNGANTRLFANSSEHLSWRRPTDTFIRTLAGTLTANRNYILPDASGTIALTAGATIPTTAQGDLLYGSAANTLSALAKNTSATRYLSNTGTSNNPAWAQVDLSNGVTGTLPYANGGTNATSQAGMRAGVAAGLYYVSITGVNFNSANTDNAIVIPTLPTGCTRIIGHRVQISNASATITTATFGVFPTTGAAGTALVNAGTAITVSSATDAAANNSQSTSTITTTSYVAASLATANTIYFRVGTAQGSAATADVTFFFAVAP